MIEIPSLYIFVNGILNFPGRSSNWTGRAVTHMMSEHGIFAEKVEYFTFATFHRMMGQRKRALKLARTMSFYQNHQIHLVAHSNGADVVFDALHYLNWPRVETVQLFSPACENDFQKLGVRTAQIAGSIGKVKVFIGEKDSPLALASSFAGRWFGYGSLGRIGPVNHVEDQTEVITRPDWGHSDWWLDQNFRWTMKQIRKN